MRMEHVGTLRSSSSLLFWVVCFRESLPTKKEAAKVGSWGTWGFGRIGEDLMGKGGLNIQLVLSTTQKISSNAIGVVNTSG